jgi:hypothetical protein
LNKKHLFRFFLISILLLSKSNGRAQDTWPPLGAIWHYEVTPGGFGPPPFLKSYTTISVVNDTLIQNKDCKKLVKSGHSFNCTDTEKYSYIYTESNQVFWYNTPLDTFSLLFDFDAKPKDTWNVLLKDCSTLTVQVDSVDFELVNFDTLTVLYTKWVSSVDSNLTHKIIQGIGSVEYLFPEYYHCVGPCHGYYFEGLRCYEDTIIGKYETALNPCDTVISVSTEEIKNKQKPKLYPNPTTTQLTIENIEIPTSFVLTDLLGNKIQSYNLSKGRNSIEFFNLPKGIYLGFFSGYPPQKLVIQ